MPGYRLWLRAWQVKVGRLHLYLLDSNDIANYPAHRGITSELYGGGPELRLQQEIVLGIGGWRLLEALNLRPEVCHLNEGHAALAILERARTFMKATGVPFDAALTATRAGNIFTTHTAVPAGFDRFDPAADGADTSRIMPRETLHIPVRRTSRARSRRTRAIDPSPSTWPIWRCAAAPRSTASAVCMAR